MIARKQGVPEAGAAERPALASGGRSFLQLPDAK